MLKDRQQKYFKCCQIGKKVCAMFDKKRYQQIALSGLYMDRNGGGK